MVSTNPGTPAPLLRVCRLLNQQGTQYLFIGGRACILHGPVRTTEDVDVLIEPSEENCRQVIGALSQLADGTARELTPRDLIENAVVKVADEVEVDVSTQTWKVTYQDAAPTVEQTEVDGVKIPFLNLDQLIAGKETCREQALADPLRLRELKRRRMPPAGV